MDKYPAPRYTSNMAKRPAKKKPAKDHLQIVRGLRVLDANSIRLLGSTISLELPPIATGGPFSIQ